MKGISEEYVTNKRLYRDNLFRYRRLLWCAWRMFLKGGESHRKRVYAQYAFRSFFMDKSKRKIKHLKSARLGIMDIEMRKMPINQAISRVPQALSFFTNCR